MTEPNDGWRLKRTTQCASCPWLIGSDPFAIPGYDPARHAALTSTIANRAEPLTPTKAMACHHEHDAHCIGWLANQLGAGNNIPLRVHMLRCLNASRLTLRGPQHATFSDTLPK